MDIGEAIDLEQAAKQEKEIKSAEVLQQKKESLNRYYQIPEDDPSVIDIEALSETITKQIQSILTDAKTPLTLERIQMADALVNLLNKYRGARSGVAIASKFNYGLFNE